MGHVVRSSCGSGVCALNDFHVLMSFWLIERAVGFRDLSFLILPSTNRLTSRQGPIACRIASERTTDVHTGNDTDAESSTQLDKHKSPSHLPYPP